MIKPGDFVKIYNSSWPDHSIGPRKWNDQKTGDYRREIFKKDSLLVISVIASDEYYVDFDVLVMWDGNLGWIYDNLLTPIAQEISCHS